MERVLMRAIVGCVLAGFLLPGCGRQADTPAGSGVAAGGVPSAGVSYTVQGEITSLPDGSPTSELRIHHEAIPTFVDRTGNAVGMKEMTMPFPLGEGVSVEGFKVGDAVEFDFTVNWDDIAGKPYYVTAMRPLPEGETLDISHEGHDHGDGHDHAGHDH